LGAGSDWGRSLKANGLHLVIAYIHTSINQY
jgi:hypothetical protein